MEAGWGGEGCAGGGWLLEEGDVAAVDPPGGDVEGVDAGLEGRDGFFVAWCSVRGVDVVMVGLRGGGRGGNTVEI